MTPQQIEMALETIALVLEDLKKTQEKQQSTITSLEEVLAEHAMRETQRLGQEIEQGPCVHAKNPKGCYRIRCQLGDNCVDDEMSFRTAPPQRTWVGLTEQEHTDIAVECGCMSADWVFYGAAVERKLKERNT